MISVFHGVYNVIKKGKKNAGYQSFQKFSDTPSCGTFNSLPHNAAF